jgi:hypothetical protein
MRNYKYCWLLIFYLFISCTSCSSSNKKTERERMLISDFLSFYFKDILQINKPIILENFDDSESNRCMEEALNGAKELGFSNRNLLKEDLTTLRLKFSPHFVLKEELPSYHTQKSWNKFKEKYNSGYFILSSPIINDQIDTIIFNFGFYCGERCGNGKTVIYRKEKIGGWILISENCNWIN